MSITPMPITSVDYIFDDALAQVIFAHHQEEPFPLFLDKNWVELIKKSSDLPKADHNTCWAKALFLGKNVEKRKLADNSHQLIMDNWISYAQPDTPFQSNGDTTGASFHALAYFEKNGFYFACDLNGHPKGGSKR